MTPQVFPPTPPLSFGALLKGSRRTAGLTQEALGAAAGYTAAYISALEHGERVPPPATAELLAGALKLEGAEHATFLQAAAAALQTRRRMQEAGEDEPAPPVGAHLGATPEGPLVARATEIGLLDAALTAVLGGAGRMIMLAGEPGIGKTRLAQEIALRARARGALVATGRCYEPHQAVAFAPFVEVLGQLCAAAPPSVPGELRRRWPEVVRLLPDTPDQERARPAATSSGTDGQLVLLWHVSGFIRAIAAVRPVVLLLDDLHWADEASLGLLLHLARQTHDARVLLVGTYRDAEVRTRRALRATLHDLGHDRLLERVALMALTADGTAALLAALLEAAHGGNGHGVGGYGAGGYGAGARPQVSGALADQIHAVTGGLPFFVEEVLRALQERGEVELRDGMWQRCAASSSALETSLRLREAIGARVEHLQPLTQAVLEEASVLGQVFALAPLQLMSARAEAAVEAALEEALLVGVLNDAPPHGGKLHGGQSGHYGFQHALVQQTIYTSIPAPRRRRLHRMAAAALERLDESQRPGSAAILMWHLLEGDAVAQALPYVLLAGDQARAIFAHSEAQQRYRQALELASELGDRGREAEALEKLANELHTLTHFDEAFALSERAVALYRALGDAEGEGRALWLMCWQHLSRSSAPGWELARLEDVLARLDVRVEELRACGLSVAGQARLFTALALALFRRGQVREELGAAGTDWLRALAAAEQAVELAQAAADDEARAYAMYIRAQTLLILGRLDEGLRDYEAVAVSAEAAGSLDLVVMALTLAQCYYQYGGEFDTSRRCIERAVALVERAGSPRTTAFVMSNRGELAYCTGDWDQARADYEEAAATMRAVETTMTFSAAKLNLGLLCLAQGQWEAAAAYLAEPLALAERMHDQQALRVGHGMLAERDLMEGHPEAARARLEPLLDRRWVQVFQIHYVLPQLAWTYLQLGDEPRALALVAESRERARADGQDFFLVDALRVQALVATRQGHWQEAEDALEESISLCRAMPYPYAEAKARYVYGQLHVAKGEPEQARERFEQALTILNRLGERLYAEQVEQLLSILDGTRMPSPSHTRQHARRSAFES